MIFLKEAKSKELDLIMAWRNNPLIYKWFSIQDKPLTWEEHQAWWYETPHKRVFIIHSGDWHRVGVVSFRHLDSYIPQVDIYIGETELWGQGVGKRALSLGMEWLVRRGYKSCFATIRKRNAAAIRLFKSVGFSRKGERYEWYKS